MALYPQTREHMAIAQGINLLIIDRAIADYQSLLAGVDRQKYRVYLLKPDRDGVEQITQILKGYSNISSLHIVSHGSPGNIYIGNSRLGADTLDRYSSQLQQWRAALTPDAEILLYGCNVAALATDYLTDLTDNLATDYLTDLTDNLATDYLRDLTDKLSVGLPDNPSVKYVSKSAAPTAGNFIQRLRELTGAKIAASNTPTGNAALGGDWDLQVRTGFISTELAFTPEVMAAYRSVLNGEYAWGKKLGGSSNDYGNSIALDSSGNAYTTGVFSGTATFGSTTLTSAGDLDAYIAKLDANGEVLWAKQLGGSSDEYGKSIALDSSGNAYTIGTFSGTTTFGSTTFTSGGYSDTYIAKLDPTGNVVWAKQLGGNGYDYGNGIALDSSGNAYATGYFYGTATFGSTTLTSAGYYDAYIAKLDANGNVVWAKQLGGSRDDNGYSIALDSSGNAYATGYFNGTANFGSTTLTSTGIYDTFIAKLDPTGEVLWAKQSERSGLDGATSIALDSSGNAYTTGFFSDTATFGSTTFTSAGSFDAFIAKLDANGEVLWAKQLGGSDYDNGLSIALDSSGNAYTTGYFSGLATFFGSTTLTSAGNDDAYIAKLDPTGEVLWAKQLGGNGANGGLSIALDSSGNAYTTGYFTGTADFDPGAGTSNLTSAGDGDIFVSKLGTPEIAILDGTTDIPDGTTSPYAFGTTPKGTPVTKTFTVNNTGNAFINLSAPTLPTGFSIVGTLPESIAPGTTANFQIQLDATAAGTFNGTLQITTNDDDENLFDFPISGSVIPQVQITQSTTPDENNSTSGTYTINLNTPAPASGLTLNYTLGGTATLATDCTLTNGSNTTLTDSTITIAPGQTSGTINLIPVDDTIIDNGETVDITLTAGTEYALGAATNASLTITDNDIASVSITPTSITATEGGATSTQDIVLTFSPTSPVTMDFATGSQIEAIAPITFDSSNWNVPQTVTVTATDDTAGEALHSATITHTATSADAYYNGIAIAPTTVEITDNDTPGVSIVQTGGSTDITEEGATDTYNIVLIKAPTADVTINISTDANTKVDTEVKFTSANWNSPQTVTVTATDDKIAEDIHTSTITHTATSADASYNGIAIASTVAEITDNDTAGVSITPTSTNASEGGETGSQDIVLTSQPTAPVTIEFATGSQIEAIAPITFDSTNWNVAQKVKISATDDSVVEVEQTESISYKATSADAGYNLIAIASTTAEITDNDIANKPPTLAQAIADPTFILNEPFNFEIPASTFTDPDNNPLTLTATLSDGSPLPGWLTFNPDTRTFSGTPPIVGNLELNVKAKDSAGAEVSDTFELAIASLSDPGTSNPNNPDFPFFPDPGTSNPNNLILPSQTNPDTFDQSNPNSAIISPEVLAENIRNGAIAPTLTPNSVALIQNGTNSDDLIIGTQEGEAIDGFAGNNIILGLGGSDNLIGGVGDDFLYGNTGADFLDGGAGNDLIYSGQDNDQASGAGGDDSIYGDKGNDIIFGGIGNSVEGSAGDRDLIFGNPGADSLFGNAGDDTIHAGKDDDIVFGGKDNDLIYGDYGSDTLYGDKGDDTLYGSNELNEGDRGNFLDGGLGNDLLIGNGTLVGGEGNDTLTGGKENDILAGGLGSDILTGGGGQNTFILTVGSGSDIILDFTDGADLLGLGSGLTFDQLSITASTSGTAIALSSTGELLATLNGVEPNLISRDDFVVLLK